MSENVFRETRRADRKVAVLHREDDLEMVQELNSAARAADRVLLCDSVYLDQQEAVFREVRNCKGCIEPFLCNQHSLYYMMRLFLVGPENEIKRACPDDGHSGCCDYILCRLLRIHS